MSAQLTVLLTDIRRMSECFDLDKQRLGETALEIAAAGVLVTMDAQAEPDGTPWRPLSKGYQEWKIYVAPGAPMGVLHGHMKQIHQIRGMRAISAEKASMTYGVDMQARIEAVKFQEGGLVTGTRQPPRPFYGFTAMAIAAADALFDTQFISST